MTDGEQRKRPLVFSFDHPDFDEMFREAVAERRAENPPQNCWLDAVGNLELYLDGVRRAHVHRDDAYIVVFDDQGNASSTLTFLLSESPYDVVESHLGISRIEEVRDESDAGWGILDSSPRERDAERACRFRETYGMEIEIHLYLRDAVRGFHLDFAPPEPPAEARQRLLDAIIAVVEQDYDKALALTRAVVESAPPQEGASSMAWHLDSPASRRAIRALERWIAVHRNQM